MNNKDITNIIEFLTPEAKQRFEEGVVDILARRKNLRILRIPGLGRLGELASYPWLDVKSLMDGGIILQCLFAGRDRRQKREFGRHFRRRPARGVFDPRCFLAGLLLPAPPEAIF